MAFLASISYTQGEISKEIPWTVREKTTTLNASARYCVEVRASDEELEFIMKNFRNIPLHVTRHEVRWYGDDAKFIAGNLGL